MLLIDSPENLTKLIENLKDDTTIYGTGTIAREVIMVIWIKYGHFA